MPYADPHSEAAKACNKRKCEKYNKAHPERVAQIFRENARQYRANNPDKAKATVLAARSKNPAARYEANKRWVENNPERTRLNRRAGLHRRRNRLAGTWTAKEWIALKDAFGNICLCCGLSEAQLDALGRKLTPDHVIPVAKGGRNEISNLQPLCFGKGGCNNRKQMQCTDYRLAEKKVA